LRGASAAGISDKGSFPGLQAPTRRQLYGVTMRRRSKYWFGGWDEGEEGDRLRDLRQVLQGYV